MTVQERPLTSVLSQIISEVAYLLQTEIRMARAEVSEKVARVASSGAMVAAGGVLLLAGFIVLLFDVVRWLAIAGLAEQWGFLIIGGIVAIIGIALVMSGIKAVKKSALYPNKTVEQMRADYSVIKEQMK